MNTLWFYMFFAKPVGKLLLLLCLGLLLPLKTEIWLFSLSSSIYALSYAHQLLVVVSY